MKDPLPYTTMILNELLSKIEKIQAPENAIEFKAGADWMKGEVIRVIKK